MDCSVRMHYLLCFRPSFKSAANLLGHMIQTHAPLEGEMAFCRVAHCTQTQMLRGAMICHFQEKHCLLHKEDGTSSPVPLSDAVIPKSDLKVFTLSLEVSLRARTCMISTISKYTLRTSTEEVGCFYCRLC